MMAPALLTMLMLADDLPADDPRADDSYDDPASVYGCPGGCDIPRSLMIPRASGTNHTLNKIIHNYDTFRNISLDDQRLICYTVNMKYFIAYIRVSTTKQGASGLGLDAQSAAITLYATANVSECKAVYREVESGKNSARPELRKAIAHAKRLKCKLVIAKLDRLSRNVHFVSGLMESGCDFIACDNPTANKLTVHILSAVAENEAEMISIRTKVALQAAKARGTLLGSSRPGHWIGREEVRSAAIRKAQKLGTKVYTASRLEASEPVYAAAREFVETLDRSEMTLQDIADAMNKHGLTTATGLEWGKMQVSRLLKMK